jgi:hypothetical protein
MNENFRSGKPAERTDGRTELREEIHARTHTLTLGYRGANRVCSGKEISSVRHVSSGRRSEAEARQSLRLLQNDSVRTQTTGGRRPTTIVRTSV